jgi:hypothetical protein
VERIWVWSDNFGSPELTRWVQPIFGNSFIQSHFFVVVFYPKLNPHRPSRAGGVSFLFHALKKSSSMNTHHDFSFYDAPLRDIGDRVFVFGSNLSGRHGKSAALEARKYHGAIYGQGVGLQGRSYAIPTKDAGLKPLSLLLIESYVEDFVAFTLKNSNLSFYVTPVGCGLAGYQHWQIAPLFSQANNCLFPLVWKPYLV